MVFYLGQQTLNFSSDVASLFRGNLRGADVDFLPPLVERTDQIGHPLQVHGSGIVEAPVVGQKTRDVICVYRFGLVAFAPDVVGLEKEQAVLQVLLAEGDPHLDLLEKEVRKGEGERVDAEPLPEVYGMVGYQQFVHHNVDREVSLRREVYLSLRDGGRDGRLPLGVTKLAREEVYDSVPLLEETSEVEISILLSPGTDPSKPLREVSLVTAVECDSHSSLLAQR